MEALSEMGYISLLRPSRTESGDYRFEPFDRETGKGGHIEVGGVNIYGLGYIGTQAGNHVARICNAVTTTNNILLFHVGIWSYSPVEIGNMRPEEALPLSETFDYVALGHGHKPYIVERGDGRPYAYNPGSPECVNFGEERYSKGYYLVTVDEVRYRHEFRPTSPRPMMVTTINLDGAEDADEALSRLSNEIGSGMMMLDDERRLLLELKLTGRVRFHPFELGRERLRLLLDELCHPLHVEIKNHLSLFIREGASQREQKNLAEIEQEVLRELITAKSEFKGREDELVRIALAIREQVMKGECEAEELLALLTAPQKL